MNPIASRVPEDTDASIEEYADKNEISKSDAIRELLKRGIEYDRLQTENERLRNEKRMIINQRDEHRELVEYVEDEQRYRQAGLVQRVKWFLRGMD